SRPRSFGSPTTAPAIPDCRCPIRASTARARSTTDARSTLWIRWRLMTSISPSCRARSDADLAVVLMVGFDDHLHQVVTHDILFIELDELDSFNVTNHASGFDEAGFPAGRQIYLSHITGNHSLRSEADSRKEHLHLFGRRILRF